MNERTVASRNLAGAFWGGFLGIILTGYLHPATLPIGCFVGVIVGWWYQEIAIHAKRSYLRGVIRVRRSWRWTVTFVLTPAWKLRSKAKSLRIEVGPALVVFHTLLFGLVWLLRRPHTFRCWLRAHPMNCAYFLRVCAVVTYYLIATLFLFVHFYSMWASGNYDSRVLAESGLGVFYALGCLVFCTTVLMAPVIFLAVDDADQVRNFYRTFERFAARGPVRFFLGEVIYLLKVTVFMVTMMFATILWCVGAGGAFLLCVVLPISACVGIVKGVYAVSTRAGHWLCFGTTLVVTATTACLTYPYLSDQQILWSVALFTGLASAGATEVTRHLILWVYSQSCRLQAMNYAPLSGQLSGSCRLFWKITACLEKKCNLGHFAVAQ